MIKTVSIQRCCEIWSQITLSGGHQMPWPRGMSSTLHGVLATLCGVLATQDAPDGTPGGL